MEVLETNVLYKFWDKNDWLIASASSIDDEEGHPDALLVFDAKGNGVRIKKDTIGRVTKEHTVVTDVTADVLK